MTYSKPNIQLHPDWSLAGENIISLVSSTSPLAIEALKSNPALLESNKNSAEYKDANSRLIHFNLLKKAFPWNPLVFCAKTVEMFEFLKEQGFPIYKLSSWHQNYLSYVIKQGLPDLVEHLISSATFDPYYENSNTLRYSLYHPEVLKVLLKLSTLERAPDKDLKSILLNSFAELGQANDELKANIIASSQLLYEAMPERIGQIINDILDDNSTKAKYNMLSNSILINDINLVSMVLNGQPSLKSKILNYAVQPDRNGKTIFCTLGLAASKVATTGKIDILIYLVKKLKEEGVSPELIETVTVRNRQTLLYNVLFDNPVYLSPFNKSIQSEFIAAWPWPEKILSFVETKEASTRWKFSSPLKEELKIICEHKFLTENFNHSLNKQEVNTKIKSKI